MPELAPDETIHDEGSDEADEDSPDGKAGVDDHCLFIHLLPLFAVGERGEARTNEGLK